MRLQLSAALSLLALLCARPAAAEHPTVAASVDLAGYTDSTQVHVASPSVAASVSDEAAGWSVGGRYLVDAVSAASVDIVATASPRWTELRHVGSAEVSYKRGAASVTASGGVSREPDYLSVSGGVVVSLDLLDKNLTPFLGTRYGHDDVGRKGLPSDRWELLQKGGLQAGATFVLSRAMIASVQLDADFERGYLAKPYRYIPLFAPGTAREIPAGASPALVNQRRLDERPVDRVPTARDRYALTGRLAGRTGRTTLRLDERAYTDSWGLWASTTDARVMVDVGSRWLLWPHLRFHIQSKASFWQRAYEAIEQPDGSVLLPSYRTGDRELSPLRTVTGGFGVKLRLGPATRAPWFLLYQFDAAYTALSDALYLTGRWSLFSVLGVSGQWS
jgi:hypothetical protein